jgi:hypothetical protein
MKPQSGGERLLHQLFRDLEHEADAQIARQRYANLLRQSTRAARHPLHMRGGFKAALVTAALALMGSWAGNIPVVGWDDGQQITIELPNQFEPASYPRWVATFANHGSKLGAAGGHSLVVDYFSNGDRAYYIRLNVLGINYGAANDWVRSVTSEVPELSGARYAITQPLVPFRKSITEMLAYRLGPVDNIERSVVDAWRAAGEMPSRNSFVYIIARPDQDARRVSMVEY